MILQFVADYKL